MDNLPLEVLKDQSLIVILKFIIPYILTALLAFLGKFIGFVFTEVFSLRLILLSIVIFLVSLFVNPYFSGWTLLIVFLAAIGYSLLRYYLGPKEGNYVIFAGFYDISNSNGYFSRSGITKLFDSQFFKTLNKSLSNHEIQNYFQIQSLEFKPPALIHTWCDPDRFERIVNRYVSKGLVTVWGTVSNGSLQHIEVKLNSQVFHGGKFAEKITNNTIEILSYSSLRTEEKVKLIAQYIAAIIGSSFCNKLAKGGKWEAAVESATESRQLFEQAIESVESQGKSQELQIFNFLRQNILPIFYIEEARSRLYGEHYEQAINRMIDTIILNPFFPLSNKHDFEKFYISRQRLEVTMSAPLKDEFIDVEINALSDKAMISLEPHLQLLINWLYEYGSEIEMFDKKTDMWFTKLNQAFPDNPYIYLYWGDAIKIPPRLAFANDGSYRKHAESEYSDGLPVYILDKVIQKYEAAYAITPDLDIIANKLFALYMLTGAKYPENSKQQKKRFNKALLYNKQALSYMDQMASSDAWKNPNSKDWSKLGLTKQDISQLLDNSSND